jgi:hypothetical protein
MPYEKKLISPKEKEKLIEKYKDKFLFEKKVDINGCCIRLWTDDKKLKEMWDENWYSMSESIRSHGRIFAVSTGKGKPIVFYERISKSAFFFDCDYYGWIKSCALAVAGDILEDSHEYYSIHGALVDINGIGTTIIGPSGTGKTTISYGLLRYKDVKLVADDWHFFKFYDDFVYGFCSEKNSYIRIDLAALWPEYKEIYKFVEVDKMGRAIMDVSKIIGKGGIKRQTEIRNVIILMRDKREKKILRKVGAEDALNYLEKNDYCNPHLLVKDPWKNKIRRESFLKLLKMANVYILNTIESPEESLKRVMDLLGVKEEKRRWEAESLHI